MTGYEVSFNHEPVAPHRLLTGRQREAGRAGPRARGRDGVGVRGAGRGNRDESRTDDGWANASNRSACRR